MFVDRYKTRFSEFDLMKMCIEEPKYLAKALDFGIAAKVGSEGLDVTRQKKQLLSLFYKAYSGLTKTL